MEKEHKYLVQSAAWRSRALQGEHLRQGYLSTDPERTVRVRAGKQKAAITIKAPAGDGAGNGDALDRSEYEYPIPVDDANRLLDEVCKHPLIEKTRFRVPHNRQVWEIDRFEKQNQGLVLAELETENGAAPKRLPRWIGEEVSGDSRFQNANLVDHPYAQWSAPKPEAKYHWKLKEEVSEGLQRIVSQELQLAIWTLSASALSLDDAVHEGRKALKKARSALRLPRGELGSEFDAYYEQENAALRDAGRKLSPLRDAHALIEIFNDLSGEYAEELDHRSLLGVRDGLVARKEGLTRDFRRQRTRSKVLGALRQSMARVEKWRLKKGTFRALSEGFATTMRRNRKACEKAGSQSSPENFHEWRKRAKDLRYHLGLMGKAWPPVLEGYEQAAKDLEQRLGDDHNLVVLRNTILEKPDDFGSQQHVQAFLEIISKHQQKLRKQCYGLASSLYADGPGEWRRRLDRCWKRAR